LPVDGLTDERLMCYRQLCGVARPHLVISDRRAQALGLAASGPVGLAISEHDDAATILALAADARVEHSLGVVAPSPVAGAAIELAKLAQRLPALLVADDATGTAASCSPPLMTTAAHAIARFRRAVIDSLAIAAEADVPLKGELPARFVIFRDAVGGSSVAVIVGTPDFREPVPLRLHSACLTGDVFGSRRCDCGDQLRLALSRIEQQGGGIILYLEQEGRGLGLANKMRAYQLQDAGLDTIDANAALGFDDDERDYGVAVRMLQILGCKRVRLLTNNPAKLDGLVQAGIEVTGRIPLQGPVNADNRRYLTAKATRAGHKLDELLAALAEPAETPEAPGHGKT
jgi:GTP cyclohydrolase II